MLKKFISCILSILMIVALIPSQIKTGIYADTLDNSNILNSSGIDVTINITDSWNNCYNADCVITNTGSEEITDWVVGFDFAETNRITNIWNASVVASGSGEVIVRNSGWNANIPAGVSVSFGFTSETNGEINIPENFSLCEKVKQEVSTTQAEFVIYNDWGNGFNGAIRIKNNGTEPLENWNVDFAYTGQFNSVSSGTLIGKDENGRWAVTDAGWNAVLQAGGSTDVQVVGEGGSLTLTDFKVYTTTYLRKNTAEESGGSTNPKITVFTEFPTGIVYDTVVDVEYEAVAGDGFTVEEVYYSINDEAEEYLYLAGGNDITAKGELGKGRVFLIPGENNIVLTVKDSSGATAQFMVDNHPVFEFDQVPPSDPYKWEHLESGSGLFAINRLTLMTYEDVPRSIVEEVVQEINGTIIGYYAFADVYYLQVPDSTEQELLEMCDMIMSKYSEWIDDVYLSRLWGVANNDEKYTDDPWWDDGSFFSPSNSQWGLNAINIPDTWETYSGHFRKVKIGVLDDGFRIMHEDLNIPQKNVVNFDKDNYNYARNHGTHVMGTIGAIHNNKKGLAGVVNSERNLLFGYDVFEEYYEGYEWHEHIREE